MIGFSSSGPVQEDTYHLVVFPAVLNHTCDSLVGSLREEVRLCGCLVYSCLARQMEVSSNRVSSPLSQTEHGKQDEGETYLLAGKRCR